LDNPVIVPTPGAALQFDLWVPNFGIQEYVRYKEETDAVFPHACMFTDGQLHPGDAPGIGVDLDEELAALPLRSQAAAGGPPARRDNVELVRGHAHTGASPCRGRAGPAHRTSMP
jgi:hypothetical protein